MNTTIKHKQRILPRTLDTITSVKEISGETEYTIGEKNEKLQKLT